MSRLPPLCYECKRGYPSLLHGAREALWAVVVAGDGRMSYAYLTARPKGLSSTLRFKVVAIARSSHLRNQPSEMGPELRELGRKLREMGRIK